MPATETSDMKGGVPVDDNTQSIPLPATETSDMKGGVPVDDNTQSIPLWKNLGVLIYSRIHDKNLLSSALLHENLISLC